MKGFYHIWAWRPSWSCDPDAANKLSFPLPKEAPHKFGFDQASGFGEKMFEIVYDGRRTDAGPSVSYKLTFEPSAPVSIKWNDKDESRNDLKVGINLTLLKVLSQIIIYRPYFFVYSSCQKSMKTKKHNECQC